VKLRQASKVVKVPLIRYSHSDDCQNCTVNLQKSCISAV